MPQKVNKMNQSKKPAIEIINYLLFGLSDLAAWASAQANYDLVESIFFFAKTVAGLAKFPVELVYITADKCVFSNKSVAEKHKLVTNNDFVAVFVPEIESGYLIARWEQYFIEGNPCVFLNGEPMLLREKQIEKGYDSKQKLPLGLYI